MNITEARGHSPILYSLKWQMKLIRNTHRFKINISYELLETGRPGVKPLIVYLHGYGQNAIRFKKKVSSLLDIEAWHLFLQGPYIIYDRKHAREVSEWGRAWYLY